MILTEQYFKDNPDKLVCYIRVVGNPGIGPFSPHTIERKVLIPEASTEEERMMAIRESGLWPWYYYLIEDRKGDYYHVCRHQIFNN